MAASIKCVVVGDGTVGKTCLLMSYCHTEFPTEYVPTIFETYAATVRVGEETATLLLFDTAGQEDYDRLRILSYPGTDIFILCFSVVCETSFLNIEDRWVPELRSTCGPEVPIILVGTKTDLRKDPDILEQQKQGQLRIISPEEGRRVAKRIQALRYMECSALSHTGLSEIFLDAIRAVVQPGQETQNGSNCCVLS